MGNNELLVIVKEPNKSYEIARIEKGNNEEALKEWIKNRIGCEHLERVFILGLGKNKNLVMFADEDGAFGDSDLNIHMRMELLDRTIIDDVYGTIVFTIEERLYKLSHRYTQYHKETRFNSITDKDEEALEAINKLIADSNAIKEKIDKEKQIKQLTVKPKTEEEIKADKERVRLIYNSFKNDVGGDTELCFGFIDYLNREHDEAYYLLGMDGLTAIEEEYIKQVLLEERE